MEYVKIALIGYPAVALALGLVLLLPAAIKLVVQAHVWAFGRAKLLAFTRNG